VAAKNLARALQERDSQQSLFGGGK
jgi:hypothetical protein